MEKRESPEAALNLFATLSTPSLLPCWLRPGAIHSQLMNNVAMHASRNQSKSFSMKSSIGLSIDSHGPSCSLLIYSDYDGRQ